MNQTIRSLVGAIWVAVAMSATAGAAEHDLKVLFQGGNVPSNVAKVLRALDGQDLLRFQYKEGKVGQVPAALIQDHLDLPTWPEAMNPLAAAWNHGLAPGEPLVEPRTILVPDLDLDSNTEVRRYERTEAGRWLLLKDKQQWGRSATEDTDDGTVSRLRLTNYTLAVPVDSEARLSRAVAALQPLRSEEIVLLHRPVQSAAEPLKFGVRFEGGLLDKDIHAVLTRFLDLGLIDTEKHLLRPGENPDEVYRARLGVPVSLRPMIVELNRSLADQGFRNLRADKTWLEYPDVRFREYEWELRLDRENADHRRHESDLRKSWDFWIKETRSAKTGAPASDSDRFVDLKLRGYELTLVAPNEQLLRQAQQELKKIERRNVVPLFPHSDPVPKYSTANTQSPQYWPPDQFFKHTELAYDIEASAGCYLRRCDPDRRLLDARDAESVSKVLVLDRFPVDVGHPDLSAGGPPQSEAGGKQQLRVHQATDHDHATHMAGLIGAQVNRFGVAGVNPKAEVLTLQWDLQDALMVDKIQRKMRFGRRSVTLFASSWQQVTSRDPVLKFLEESRPFWVVAAGQCKGSSSPALDCDDGGNGVDLENHSKRAPTNRAHLPNVLVVTACDDCYGPQASVPANFNRSRTHAHVAAPGNDVFSLLDDAHYGSMSGTSQAAALVAGVASAMIAMHDHYYEALFLKRRIQVTSTFQTLRDLPVASGAVDLTAALLSPVKHHWRREGSKTFEPFEDASWSIAVLDVVKDGRAVPLPVQQIMRLQRIENEWVIYYAERDDFENWGTVHRLGPVTIRGKPGIVLHKTRTVKPLDELSDVLLFDSWPAMEAASR